MLVTSSNCSNCPSPSLHPHLITNKLALFRATNRLLLKTARNAKNGGGLSRFKQHKFVIFKHISQKFGGKVYVLLLNNWEKISCNNLYALVKYQQKTQEITFLCSTLYMTNSTAITRWLFFFHISTISTDISQLSICKETSHNILPDENDNNCDEQYQQNDGQNDEQYCPPWQTFLFLRVLIRACARLLVGTLNIITTLLKTTEQHSSLRYVDSALDKSQQ